MNESSRASVLAARLFSRLRAVYGNRMEAMWGGADPKQVLSVWSDELARFELADIESAIEGLKQAHPSYPPTLFEFAGLCEAARSRRAQDTKALPPPRTSMPETIREQFRRFREKHVA